MLANFFISVVTNSVVVNLLNGVAYSFGFLAIFLSFLFSQSYPVESKFIGNRKALITSIAAALIFSIFSATSYIAGTATLNSDGEINFSSAPVEHVYTVIALLLVIAIAIRSIYLISATKGTEKSQAIYIMLALGASILVGITGNLILPLFNIDISYEFFSPITSLIVISFIAYAITRHGLFDVRPFIARSFAYALSLIVIIGIFLASTVLLFSTYLNKDVPTSEILLFAILSLILAILFQPVKYYFDKISNKIFYRDSYNAQDLINKVNSRLVNTLDLNKLLSNTAELIEDELHVEFCDFYLDPNASIEFHLAGTNSKLFTNPAWPLFLEYFTNNESKVVRANNNELDSEVKSALYKLDIEIAIKMNSNGEEVGYLMVGPRKSGSSFTNQDTQLLEIIADEVAIAVQNSLRFSEISQFNVTLQKKINNATNELQQSNEKLVKLDEAKDEFISMASHQLRTPLTSVKGYISMILEGDAGEINETQKKFLDQAYISSQRMVYLIADLLNVSRLKTGKFVIEKAPTYLPDVIESEVSQLYGTAEARDLKMIFHKPDEFPMIDLDETKIRQVIMNFADNAIYYTPHGGKITIELKKLKNSIEYTVTDTGIGVPKAEQHHLFNKFYRAANAKQARPDGTGLGLFMAKKVIIAQGGAIIFKTTEGKGSTFGFSFPLPKEEPAEESEK
jgi:signal transduction histidine kinase